MKTFTDEELDALQARLRESDAEAAEAIEYLRKSQQMGAAIFRETAASICAEWRADYDWVVSTEIPIEVSGKDYANIEREVKPCGKIIDPIVVDLKIGWFEPK